MAAAPSLTTNDADDDNKYFGVIEVDMDDIVNLSQFYGNNQSDHVVEFKKDVKSEELDTTEKEVE
jgi:aconitase B